MNLKSITLKVEQILLDPNNPRFVKNQQTLVPEKRYHEEEVQSETLRKMSEEGFDINDIKDSMKKNGFLAVDNIFVKKVAKDNLYYCVEGNRRMTAIKQIIIENNKGQVSIDEDKLLTLKKIEVLDVSSLNQNEIDTVLGLRHIGGIKPWEPLPSAFNLYKKYMEYYCEDVGVENTPDNFAYFPKYARNVSEAFSTKMTNVRDNSRAYRTFFQIENECINRGLEFDQRKFSIIVEVAGNPALRNYYELDENSATFSEHGLENFIEHVVGDGPDKEPIILQATAGEENMRDFGYILNHGNESDEIKVTHEEKKPHEIKSDIIARKQQRDLLHSLKEVTEILNKLKLGDIKELSDSEKGYINSCEEVLAKLKRVSN